MDDHPGVVDFCQRMRPRLEALSLYCGDRGAAEELAVDDRWAHPSGKGLA